MNTQCDLTQNPQVLGTSSEYKIAHGSSSAGSDMR